MNLERGKGLEKNFTKMFWIRALLELNIFSLVSTLFCIYRGVSLPQVMLLPVVWAVSNIVLEVPSSYLADRWGRKKTIILGTLAGVVSIILFFISENFFIFALATFFSGFKFAMISGTDEALVYDTSRELHHVKTSLSRLGTFYSGRNILKIITPVVAAFIAKDLFEYQMLYVIAIDAIASIIGVVVALLLVEPHRYMDVEGQELGIMRDAWRLLVTTPGLLRVVLSRAFIFSSGLIIWRYHQELLISSLGISFLILGISWAIANLCMFLFKQYIIPSLHQSYTTYINVLNIIFLVAIAVSAVSVWYGLSYVSLIVLIFSFSIEEIRWPLYAEFFNHKSKSYNRATALSLMNFVKNIFDVPLLLVASVLISYGMIFPFFISIGLALLVVLFFKVPRILYEPKTS